jgi:integrase
MGDVLHFPERAANTAYGPSTAVSQPAAQAERPRRKVGMASHAQGSLVALVDKYTEDRVAAGEASRRTALDQRLTLLQFSASYGERPVKRMGEADIVRWMGTTADLRPSTRRNKLSVVKGFCRWLVRRGHVRTDPTISVKAPRQPRTVPKVFEGDAVALLLDGCPDARARLIVLLMVQMGLRCGEVADLELGDIDGQLAVVQGKGGHQRVVPLPTEVRSALAAYLVTRGGCAGPLIDNYQHPGRGLTSHTVSALVRDMCAAVGIKRFPHDGISAHGLRRTCGSDLADRDVPMLDIAAAFGHQSIETTKRYYTRHRASRLTKVMEGRWYGRQRIGETG